MSNQANLKDIVEAYQEAADMEDGDDKIQLMQTIETDLIKAGSAGIVACKRILIEKHEERIESIFETVRATSEVTSEQEQNLAIERGCISILKAQIRVCMGIPDEPTQDAKEELEFCIERNPTIQTIDPIPCEIVVRTAVGVKNLKEFAVEITPSEGNKVVLTIDELGGLFSILKDFKPPVNN